MTPQSQATREALIIGVLNAWGGFPISTREIGDSVHPAGGHTWVLGTLHHLVAKGEVERWRPSGSRTYYWRR